MARIAPPARYCAAVLIVSVTTATGTGVLIVSVIPTAGDHKGPLPSSTPPPPLRDCLAIRVWFAIRDWFANRRTWGPQTGQALGCAWKRRFRGSSYSLWQAGHMGKTRMVVFSRS